MNQKTPLNDTPFPPPKNPTFTFIDLFAGIGGFRRAFQNLGGKCVFSSEWDKYARLSYQANYGEFPHGDITSEETKSFIPDNFDILCAGFPCQAFSIAGKKGGFNDTRGSLFFQIADILKRKQPKAFLLENVKGLKSHNDGKTLSIILNILRNELNYFVPEPQILNAKDFGLPQNRERIFIVGFRKSSFISEFNYPEPTNQFVCLADLKEEKEVSVKYYLSDTYLQTIRNHKRRHQEKGNGFGYQVIPKEDIANTLVVGGMGQERNLVVDLRLSDFTPITNIKGEINKEGIRRMTPKEWARLQGFCSEDDNRFMKAVKSANISDTQLYKQLGNSVAIPVVEAVGRIILNCLR